MIVDATAGLGRDFVSSFSVFRCAGHFDRTLRGNALIVSSRHETRIRERLASLAKIIGPHEHFLKATPYLIPEIVCRSILEIDPMHPERENSALVKLELAVKFREIGGHGPMTRLKSCTNWRSHKCT